MYVLWICICGFSETRTHWHQTTSVDMCRPYILLLWCAFFQSYFLYAWRIVGCWRRTKKRYVDVFLFAALFKMFLVFTSLCRLDHGVETYCLIVMFSFSKFEKIFSYKKCCLFSVWHVIGYILCSIQCQGFINILRISGFCSVLTYKFPCLVTHCLCLHAYVTVLLLLSSV